jgi:hypothetical protein
MPATADRDRAASCSEGSETVTARLRGLGEALGGVVVEVPLGIAAPDKRPGGGS